MVSAKSFLEGVPHGLRSVLLDCYQEIVRNYLEHRWEPSELNGGKFCEVVFTILDGAISGHFPEIPSKPRDMVSACRGLEGKPANKNLVGDESLRVLIPKMLLPLYEVRNKRGVGHVGGEVNPNSIDAAAVYAISAWIMAELIRIFHNVSIQTAQEYVNILAERKCSLVWEFDGVRRVLDPRMSAKDKCLVLLYGQNGWIAQDKLFHSVEYSRMSLFRTRVLKELHLSKLVESDDQNNRVCITTLGSKEVEDRIIKQL